MSKIVKYSKLVKTANSPLIFIPMKKSYEVLLDEDLYHILDDNYNKKVKSIIISENLSNKSMVLKLIDINANSIYVENHDNLGDITIPFDIKSKISIDFNIFSKIKKVHILNVKNTSIDLKENIKELLIYNEHGKFIIDVNYNKEKITYEVDKLGNVNEIKKEYKIDESDIKDNNLNICNLTEYKSLKFPNIEIDTLIINKHYIEKIKKISYLSPTNGFIPFHNYLRFNNLKIVDDNEMLLNPFDITFENANFRNTYFCSDNNKNYIYINGKDNNDTLIYIDNLNKIKIIEKNKLIKEKNVKNVIIDYQRSRSNNLIMIKYKDYYKILDFDDEYIFDSTFFLLISRIARKYFDREHLIDALNNYDFETVFNSIDFNKKYFLKCIMII